MKKGSTDYFPLPEDWVGVLRNPDDRRIRFETARPTPMSDRVSS